MIWWGYRGAGIDDDGDDDDKDDDICNGGVGCAGTDGEDDEYCCIAVSWELESVGAITDNPVTGAVVESVVKGKGEVVFVVEVPVDAGVVVGTRADADADTGTAGSTIALHRRTSLIPVHVTFAQS